MFNWKAEIVGDRMRFLGEEYPLGHFCLELLQVALVDDAAQRVSILWAFLEPTLHELQNGLVHGKMDHRKEVFAVISKISNKAINLSRYFLTTSFGSTNTVRTYPPSGAFSCSAMSCTAVLASSCRGI